MAYEKQAWATGDIITSAKLNHLENGVANAGGTLVIGGFSYDANAGKITGTADKTWQEIDNALAIGVRCVVVITNLGGHVQQTVLSTSESSGTYQIYIDKSFIATTTSADGYPSNTEGPL